MKMNIYNKIKEFARQIENKEIVETKEILMKQDSDGWSVAYLLADYHPTWTTDDPEILSLYHSLWNQTVEDVLVKRNKM